VNLWRGFKGTEWKDSVNVGNFIENNYKEYIGNSDFLCSISPKTKKVWDKILELEKKERTKGILGVELSVLSGIENFKPGYIDRDNEVIFGLQTDEPLKRILNLEGGYRMGEKSLEEYGFKMPEKFKDIFTNYRKTHNDGVFDVYTEEILKARKCGLLTGLPDAYGRGRIIGDYRRVALYGINYLIEQKKCDYKNVTNITEGTIRIREELAEQIRALESMKNMAYSYGFDISKPACNAKEAFQWLYFGYLAAIKENNGAAMSLGRTSTFLDIYIERDIEEGNLTESEAQELVDQFVIKLRVARHLRTPEYDALFAGDPTWITESIGGMSKNGESLVTKNSYRYLHTLKNLGPSPEPNLTVLWSQNLPDNFKDYCAQVSIDTDSIQYESDEAMRPIYGDDYGIACCVSAMELGKQMQFFGARTNIAKALLYAINGGVDEKLGIVAIDGLDKITDDILDYDKVKDAYFITLEKIAKIYVDAMNIIHYMHDKYAYEKSQMALHDTNVGKLMAFGVAGLSVVADSLSAIKYAKVKPIRNEFGIAVDFEIEGNYPKYGNDDDRVDLIAVDVVTLFSKELKKHKLYKKAKHTLSVLTITSNVVYGAKTGATPDGRASGEAFAPGANPMHGRDENGALASLNSVSKLPYACVCEDGVSNTFSIVPDALGHSEEERSKNLVNILDGYFMNGSQHLNVNVLNRETLMDAMENPDKYPNLTIRVSGYAVKFNRLDKNQQLEVISRTFHERV